MKWLAKGVVAEKHKLLGWIHSFIKIKEYFCNIKTKGREGSRVFMKIQLLHQIALSELIKILKE